MVRGKRERVSPNGVFSTGAQYGIREHGAFDVN